MSTIPYVSCIKIRGIPIIPPLITPEIREVCHGYKLKAIEREKRKERSRLHKKCMEDLERIENQTKDLTVQTSLENQLAFAEDSPRLSPSHVPYDTLKKLQNLTSETIDVSEYSDEGVKVLSTEVELEEKLTLPKLIRSNSYTLISPSPILLAHLQKEAQKCMEMDDSESRSLSPITIIDSEIEPPVQVVDTDILVQQVTVTTPVKLPVEKTHQNIDSQLLDILDKLPPEHARNILEILSKQEENNKSIKEQINDEDKSISLSISSQSLYYSTISPDTTRESPNQLLNIINLHNVKKKTMSPNQAANVIQAHVRGYLVRRLIRTERVQSLINTIKDALLCALQLHGVEVIEEADVELHRRLIQQVSAACYAFHDIFFAFSIKDQMGLIAVDRQRKIEKANRPLSASSSNLSLSRRQSARIIK